MRALQGPALTAGVKAALGSSLFSCMHTSRCPCCLYPGLCSQEGEKGSRYPQARCLQINKLFMAHCMCLVIP